MVSYAMKQIKDKNCGRLKGLSPLSILGKQIDQLTAITITWSHYTVFLFIKQLDN